MKSFEQDLRVLAASDNVDTVQLWLQGAKLSNVAVDSMQAATANVTADSLPGLVIYIYALALEYPEVATVINDTVIDNEGTETGTRMLDSIELIQDYDKFSRDLNGPRKIATAICKLLKGHPLVFEIVF